MYAFSGGHLELGGVFRGRGISTGDSSGGTNSVNFTMKPAQARNSIFVLTYGMVVFSTGQTDPGWNLKLSVDQGMAQETSPMTVRTGQAVDTKASAMGEQFDTWLTFEPDGAPGNSNVALAFGATNENGKNFEVYIEGIYAPRWSRAALYGLER